MRRLVCFLAPSLLFACGSGTGASSAAAEASLSTALAQSGVQCARHDPPSVQACTGKKAGDACDEVDDEGTETGVCKAIPDGRLVCDDGADRDGGEAGSERHDGDGGIRPPPAPLTDACAGKSTGATCSVAFGGESFTGTCKSVAGFTVCLPAPEPPPAPITACSGKTAGASCTVTLGNKRFDGNCRLFADHGVLACLPPVPTAPPDAACDGKKAGDPCHEAVEGAQFDGACHALPAGMRCLPRPPPPPAAAVDACVDHKAQDPCSFRFKDHDFSGACQPAPDGTTLVCAPICHR